MVGRKRMNWMENLLIVAGVSLDIFAAMECQGSLVAKINKKNLTVICGIVALAQLITLYLGHFCPPCSAVTGRCRTKSCWDRLYPW